MTGSILSYQQTDPIRLLCDIDLQKLFPDSKERDRFDKNSEAFLESDPCNKKIFKLRGNRLIYHSEHLIPIKKDKRPPLLMVFGNPASHSVAAGMVFAFKDNRKENRFFFTDY